MAYFAGITANGAELIKDFAFERAANSLVSPPDRQEIFVFGFLDSSLLTPRWSAQ
jgi:hypothetical protein